MPIIKNQSLTKYNVKRKINGCVNAIFVDEIDLR